MTKVHLTARGKWVRCAASERACPRSIHLPDVTPAQVALMPEDMLATLIEIIDPPTVVKAKTGSKVWMQNGRPGRDNDLPAIIDGHGKQSWYLMGKLGRLDDKPSEISANGTLRWHIDGLESRAGDRPSTISPSGQLQWRRAGKWHREGGRPAQIDLATLAVYLRHGKHTYPALHRQRGVLGESTPGEWMTPEELRRHGSNTPFSWWQDNVRQRLYGRWEVEPVLQDVRAMAHELPAAIRANPDFAPIFD